MYYVSTYFRSDSRIRTLEGPSRSSLAQWSDIFLKSNLNSYDFLDKFCIFFLCILPNRKLKTNYLCTFKNKVFAIVVDPEVHIWKYSTKIFAQNLPIWHVFILLGSLLKFHKLDRRASSQPSLYSTARHKDGVISQGIFNLVPSSKSEPNHCPSSFFSLK